MIPVSYTHLDVYKRQTADRVGKIFVNDIFINTDRLEDLRTLVRLDRGNTHLGCDLYDTCLLYTSRCV